MFFFLNSLSLSRPLYFPTLYQIYVELEGAVLTSNSRVRIPIGADTNVFPSYSGVGYAIFPAYKVTLFKVVHKIVLVVNGRTHFEGANRIVLACCVFFKTKLSLPEKRFCLVLRITFYHLAAVKASPICVMKLYTIYISSISINQLINQSINHSINQSINQSIHDW